MKILVNRKHLTTILFNRYMIWWTRNNIKLNWCNDPFYFCNRI